MFHKPHTDKQSGFVLLEVLIAAVLATLTLITVFHVYSTSFSGSARSERVTIALLAAESKLAELGVTQALEPGINSGALDDGYRWRTDIQPYAGLPAERLERLPVRAFTVAVTVSWGPGGGQNITLNSLRLAPSEDGRGAAR